jgi:predicted enzyme related to lactoylglutathione lyase
VHVNAFILNITSDQPEALRRFYRDVVGLPVASEVSEATFTVGGGYLSVDAHSEIRGPTKEPQRDLLNFLVADLEAEQRRLEARGVPFIRTAGREDWGGVISTFLDPDGNYCQIVQVASP